jgi:hypothetical protein
MRTSLLTHPVARRAGWAAILAALLIAAVALSGLGPRPAPAAPVLRINANPPVHQTAPESFDRQPGAAVSITGDSVETQSPTDAPIGMVEPDRAIVNAGGVSGGVLGDRDGGAGGGVKRAGGARAGVDMRD